MFVGVGHFREKLSDNYSSILRPAYHNWWYRITSPDRHNPSCIRTSVLERTYLAKVFRQKQCRIVELVTRQRKKMQLYGSLSLNNPALIQANIGIPVVRNCTTNACDSRDEHLLKQRSFQKCCACVPSPDRNRPLTTYRCELKVVGFVLLVSLIICTRHSCKDLLGDHKGRHPIEPNHRTRSCSQPFYFLCLLKTTNRSR